MSRNSSWVWKKKLPRVLAAASLIGSFFVLFAPRIDYTKHHFESEIVEVVPETNITITADVGCDPDFEVLKRLHVQKLTQYVRREVVAVRSANDALPLSQTLDIPLFEQASSHRDKDPAAAQQLQNDCSVRKPVSLHVPRPPPTVDASHFDFGIATTLNRLNDSLDAFSHWAGYTRTRIFALIEPDDRVPEVLAKADSLGINLYVTESDEEYNRRYFSLVSHLAENARDGTRWSCIMDDDTFFISMAALMDAFQQYDDTKPMYVGGLSESIAQIGLFGLMGFGGAGVFLSRPLLDQLSQPEIFNVCRDMDFTGDRRISLCIYQYTDTYLTIDHRLRQLDVLGDVTGFFEAARPPPLSVHHWKSWFHADMAKMSKVGEVCGDTCLLRKWRFTDGWILTNGFSISKYSKAITPNDKSMELTWIGDHGAAMEAFMHELGPLRPKDEGKITYLMEDSVIDGDQVRQWYIHRDPENGDQVMELVWLMR
ncbi:hypothetical protein P175DRAFT_0430035 [Aspergillus ochraceoroseus IBT 24754]|nr:uncharacterized protein P175DRAFT_0430035 [Aspergillus ochraceoroseus IBT 24754]PTU24249.1 hypothetical protein P175DRAFT_0430035 [Aspergillus ochraceoroseus IBT 24754]